MIIEIINVGSTLFLKKLLIFVIYDIETIWLNNSKNHVYICHVRFLPKYHSYRNMKHQFDETRETTDAPKHFNGELQPGQGSPAAHGNGKKKSKALGK